MNKKYKNNEYWSHKALTEMMKQIDDNKIDWTKSEFRLFTQYYKKWTFHFLTFYLSLSIWSKYVSYTFKILFSW